MFKVGDKVKFKNTGIEGHIVDYAGKMMLIETNQGNYYAFDYQVESLMEQDKSDNGVQVLMEFKQEKLPADVVDLQQYDVTYNGKKELSLVKVIYNDKATILFYQNKTGAILKSVAKCHPEDKYDKEKGFSVALHKALIKEKMKEYSKVVKDLEKLEFSLEKLTK